MSAYDLLLNPLTESDLKDKLTLNTDILDSGISVSGHNICFQSGALSVIAGPTGHGKTQIMINIMYNMAIKYPDKHFYFLSFEEDCKNILLRFLNLHVGLKLSENNILALRNYFKCDEINVDDKTKQKFLQQKDEFFKDIISAKRVHICNPNLKINELKDFISDIKSTDPSVGGIFIDYLQLLQADGDFNSRQEELKLICLKLNTIAINSNLPFILAAQFNRNVKNKYSLLPTNISEAGDIERIANLIIGIWNNSYKETDVDKKKELTSETIYISVVKNRYGKINISDTLKFNGNIGKIGT